MTVHMWLLNALYLNNCHRWCIIDVLTLAPDWALEIVAWTSTLEGPSGGNSMRLLRVFRVVRVARLLRASGHLLRGLRP